MARVPSFPWSKINDFLLQVCAARNLNDFNALVCAHIADLIPHDFPILCVTSNRSDLYRLAKGEHPNKLIDPTILAVAGEPGTVAAWNQYFRFRLPITDGYFASSIVSDFRPYADTEFVTDFVTPRSVELCLGGWFRHFTVVVPRCRPARYYSEQEIAISRVVSPHLENHFLALSSATIDPQASPPMKADTSSSHLTEREHEVALLLAERLTMSEIADRLFISRRTVEKHAERIYEKFGVRKKQELGKHLLKRPQSASAQ
jgi:DNA-binding CsgD family transcriptional regulator